MSGAPVTDWSSLQSERVDEASDLKELGSLFGLDYEDEENRTELEILQGCNEALEQARLADSVDGEVDIDFGTGFIEAEAGELDTDADDLIEKDTGEVKKKKRAYSREQLDVLERECFGGTMKNADLAAAIARLNGAREVTTQDVRAWRSNAKAKRRKAAV